MLKNGIDFGSQSLSLPDNNPHVVKFDNGVFQCDCEFFFSHQHCAHTMALEILLKDMLPEPAEA